MNLNRRGVLAAPVLALPATAVAAPATDELAALLKAQTQALADAVAPGKVGVWETLLHPSAVVSDEEGNVQDRAAILAGLKPLPPGVGGTITVTDFQARQAGDVAITNYVLDEHEQFHGQALHCQYRATDTWLQTPEGWRQLASQVMALRADPPSIPQIAVQLDAYVGRYRLAPDMTYDIARTPAGLTGRTNTGAARPLLAEARDVLFTPGRPRYRMVFKRDAAGRIVQMAERREQWDLVWVRET